MRKPNPKIRLRIIGLVIFVLGLWGIPLAWAVIEEDAASEKAKNLTDYKFFQEPNISVPPETSQKKPETLEYAASELIVKLKKDKTLADIQELNTKYNVTSTDKLFKDTPSPQEALNTLKNKLTKLNTEHQTWYWQLDKGSQEYKDYIAKIEKEKEVLQKQIQTQEELIAHLEQRQERAPEGITPPNLESTYLIKTANPGTDIPLMAAEYSANPSVEYAEPNYTVKAQMVPNDPYYASSNSWEQGYGDLWGLKKIEAEKAWDISQGEGVVVAIVDTGVDYTHEDMADNILLEKSYDFVNNDSDPMDDYGHGTHVAGIIAAVGNNAKGIIGVAPKAKVIAVKGLDNKGSGYTSILANCLRYAADSGADVINNSWGGEGKSSLIEDAVNYAYSKGCVVVAAAGNSNSNATNFFPANLSNVITVASVDQNDRRSFFSNFGTNIDVAAPGSGDTNPPPSYMPFRNILSLKALDTGDSGLVVGEKYLRQAGTSMACPYVSGAAALVLSRKPEFTNEEVKQVLRVSADDRGLPGFDTDYGAGRINAYKALFIDSVCLANISFPESFDMSKTGTVKIKGTASGVDFHSYKLEYGDVNFVNWTQIGVLGSTAVTDDTLSEWNIPISGEYYLRLTVTDKNSRTFQDVIGPIFIDKGLRDGWPRYIESFGTFHSSGISSTPLAVADVDKDNKKEIIVGASGKVYILKDNGENLAGWPIEIGSDVVSDVSLADIDGDGDLEIFFACSNQYVYGYHHNGLPIDGWPQYISEDDYGFYGVAIGDVDGCASPEIIVFALCPDKTSSGYAYIFKKDGVLLSKWMLYNMWNKYTESGGSLGDINKDGKLEIVVPMIDTNDSFHYIYIFDYKGNILKTLKLDGITAQISGGTGCKSIYDATTNFVTRPVLGDLDQDGDLEIVISRCYINPQGYYAGKLFIWSYDEDNYTNVVAKDTGSSNAGQLALADIDNNGDLEILGGMPYINSDGYMESRSQVKAFKYDGSLLWETNKDDASSSYFYASPIIGDINGDGKKEIIMVDTPANIYNTSLKLYIYKQDGSLSSVYKMPGVLVGFTNFYSPVIADVDNDGNTELVAIQNEKGLIAVWNMRSYYNESLVDWPQFQRDLQRTGLYTQPTPSNQPPEFSPIGNKNADEGQLLEFSILATDPDADTLTYSAINLPAGATFSGQAFSWTPTYAQAGAYEVSFKVEDGNGGEDTETITITVNDVNRVPLLTSPGNKTVNESQLLQFTLSASDSDGDSLTYSASNLPAGATFAGQAFSWTPTYAQAGAYEVDFKVEDGKGEEDSEAIVITVKDVNRAPDLAPIRNKIIYESQLLQFTLSATDPDGDSLTYSASNLPAGATFAGQAFSWTPTYNQAGRIYKVTFEVKDSKNAVTSKTVTISVKRRSLQGRVVEQKRAGRLINATVKLTGERISKKATTNNLGYYSLGDLPIGIYKVTVSKIGYVSQSRVITVTNTDTSKRADFTLKRKIGTFLF